MKPTRKFSVIHVEAPNPAYQYEFRVPELLGHTIARGTARELRTILVDDTRHLNWTVTLHKASYCPFVYNSEDFDD